MDKKLLQKEINKLFKGDNLLILILVISTLYSVVLSILRILYSGSNLYIFLNWNLFLAWVPLGFAYLIRRYRMKQESMKVLDYVLVFSWLLFFPNSPYIITDFLHLREMHNIPLWYDVILIMTFAWNGLIVGFVSLKWIQEFVSKIYGILKSWIFVYVCLILGSFGIYLGRFLRWNSWDILKQPNILFYDIADRVVNPFMHPRTIGVTLLFSTFLFLAYLVFVFFKDDSESSLLSKK